MITRIRDNLWQVGGRGLTDPTDAAVYLVRFGDTAALVDAGCGRSHGQLVENISKCLGPHESVACLLLTHCHFDHAGGARAIKEQFGCAVAAHALDASYLESGDSRVTAAARHGAEFEPFKVDIALEGPESTLAIGTGTVTAIHCPGHTPGSLIYTTHIDGQLVLFGQDLHGPLHSEWLSDEQQYLDSLARVLDLQADLLLEGHFGIIAPQQEVREYILSCITPSPQPCRC